MSSPSPHPIRVALVEDDPNFHQALLEALKGVLDIVPASLATTRSEGLALLAGEAPDVLLVDLGLPDGSGIDVIRAAHARWPLCAIMVCTVFGDESHVMQAIESGASGYLLKDCTPARIAEEIRILHLGGSPISPIIARQVLMRFRAAPADAAPAATEPAPTPRAMLSARESQVLDLITKGFTAEEIGNLLGVSRYTVLSYIRRIYAKLEVNSKAEAIFEARALGILR